jgi:hypothetical protein
MTDASQENCPMQNAWKNADKIIRSENTLAHYRMTAFLTLQGLLFASFSFPLKTILRDPMDSALLYCLLWLLALTGFNCSLLFHDVIRRSNKHIIATRFWFYFYWYKMCGFQGLPKKAPPPFPSLTGGGNFGNEFELDYVWYCDQKRFDGDYIEMLKMELGAHDKKHRFRLRKGSVRIPIWGSLGVVRLLAASWFVIFIGLIVLGVT